MAANTLVYSESALRVKAAFYNKKLWFMWKELMI